MLGRKGKGLIATLWMAGLIAACQGKGRGVEEAPSPSSSDERTGVSATINVFEDFEGESIEGYSESRRALRTMRPECAGHIGEEADLFLHVQEERVLRLQANPVNDDNADLVLAAMSSSGLVLCSDDADGLNPRLESRFTPGQYRVWVGSFEEGKSQSFALHVTDVLKDVPEGPAPVPIDGGEFGGFAVRPDTGAGSLRGRAGGTREANAIGPGCVGFIGMRPDHVLTLESAMRLRVSARATDADLVLLLQDSQGRVLCNDDADGRNPALFEEMGAGTWNVYVGSYAPSHYPEYVFRVSR